MSKRKKKQRGRESTSQLLKRAERELGKGNAKGALRDAKVAFRNEPTPDARQLLEAAYAGRVEQLQRQNQIPEARAVLGELLELEPLTPKVCDRLPRLRVLVGDQNADPAAIFEQEPGLLIELVDAAVLDWKCIPPDHADIAAQVTAVREALSAAESGDDDRAAALLQAIPRTSPLGDWKLFVRGLGSFYQRDNERMEANWRRLDPARPAHRIVQALLAAIGEGSAGNARGVKRLQTQVGDSQGFHQLEVLAELWRGGDLRRFFNELRRFRQRHGKTHAGVLRRIAELAWRRSIREQDDGLLSRVQGWLPAPELDPHWNRARAMMAECSRDGDASAVEQAWKAYARDLRNSACLRDDERAIAEGLVYLRLGRKFVEFAKFNETRVRRFWDDEQDNSSEWLRKSACEFLRHCIQTCPRLADAYRELARLHEELEQLDEAASVYNKLLEQVSDDFDAQVWLARFHLERDEPNEAENYVIAARRLKPRHPQCRALEWTQQLTKVRCLAKKRKLDEARQELRKLYEIRPEDVDLFTLDAIAAAIEFKAKDPDAANEFVNRAVARLEEPTAVWLWMSYLSATYSLPRDVKKQFNLRYKAAMENELTSQTAGLLGKFFVGLKDDQINYVGRATQERLAIANMERAVQTPSDERDLCQVCDWLMKSTRQAELLDYIVETGLDRFPNSPRLLFFAGGLEMSHGPFSCDAEHALERFRSALEQNAQSPLPLSTDQIELAHKSIGYLEDLLEQRPPHQGGIGSFIDDDDDDDDDDAEDDWMGGDEDDEFGAPFDLGGITGMPADIDVNQMIDSLPAELRRELKKIASITGVSLETLVLAALAAGSAEEAQKQNKSKPRRQGSGPHAKQSQFGFAQDE